MMEFREVDTLFQYYYYKNKVVGGGEVLTRNLFQTELRKVTSRYGWAIIEFFFINRASTKSELCKKLGISFQSINTYVNIFVDYGYIKPHSKVMSPYCLPDQREPMIFVYKDYQPEDVIDAQRRYAVIKLGYDPVKQQEIVSAQKTVEWEKSQHQQQEAASLIDEMAQSLQPWNGKQSGLYNVLDQFNVTENRVETKALLVDRLIELKVNTP